MRTTILRQIRPLARTMPRAAVRWLATAAAKPHVQLPPAATVHPFGSAQAAEAKDALLRFPEAGWRVSGDGSEGWAIVGDAEGRRLAVETILGRHRILPPSPALPVNELPVPPRASSEDWRAVRYLAFARPSTTGEFTDYTARYGALQEEDKLTLREKLSAAFGTSAQAEENIAAAVAYMDLGRLVDMPAIALSSGQTRRARIAQALMTRPALLILEDPMAGLDAPSRIRVDKLLGELNAAADEPRIVVVLRDKGDETLASWVSDVVEVRGGDVWVGPRAEWEARRAARGEEHHAAVPEAEDTSAAEPIVQLQGVNVAYAEGARRVLKDVDWAIRPGDRWHLQGSNGSGKTTLLSVLLGHHPRSFALPASALTLFGKPRRETPTPVLRALIGHTSPEVFAAFPRNMSLDAEDAVGSGYEGVFSRRKLTPGQKERVLYLLEAFRPFLAKSRTGRPTDATAKQLSRQMFAHYTPPQQALLLFLRAVVSRPPLLVLDEPTQGMDEEIWEACRAFLVQEWAEMKKEGKEQAVVVVSHYEDEVPWKHGRVLKLDDGVATSQ
ncbi:putative ABC transporter ATP-binding protein [Vanrija pseudolonga]|uniref:Purtative ABC transporter ATP-binding protein n=1 Tax=Vanrija pseudolonga TaxID=143232 RepID=A0AAF0Y8U0_9TREE|nr:purtative ABC transporter ATP-binding protein [Vanrija pseudolonga]